MRCLSCNEPMTDRDSSRKFVGSGTYVDLCKNCFKTIEDQVDVIDNKSAKDDFEEENEDWKNFNE